MRKNKRKKQLTTILGAVCLCAGLLATPVAAMPVQANAPVEEPGISPNSDIIQWVFKVTDGKLYKRLYNHTKGIWIGDWIYVRDWDE